MSKLHEHNPTVDHVYGSLHRHLYQGQLQDALDRESSLRCKTHNQRRSRYGGASLSVDDSNPPGQLLRPKAKLSLGQSAAGKTNNIATKTHSHHLCQGWISGGLARRTYLFLSVASKRRQRRHSR
jgi:hypothetical protein